MSKTTTYTIEQLSVHDMVENKYDIIGYFNDVAPKLSEMFDNKFDWRCTPYSKLFEKYIFLVCIRNGKISGHMICNLFTSPLDYTVTILYQVSFHAKPDSGRTAYHLFQKFLDIGKTRANHVITQRTAHTNIKASTLESMGFKEMETLYRLEIT